MAAIATPAALGLALVACGGPQVPARPHAERIADPAALVAEYYRRVNAEDLSGVMALLVPEPVLSEPFSASGALTVHRGYRSVANFFAYGFRTRDDQIVPEFITPRGGEVDVGWSLHGADGTGMSGTTAVFVRNGQIARIDISLRE